MSEPLSPKKSCSVRLFGADTGWSLAPVVDWIVHTGRKLKLPKEFVQGLGRQLVQAEAPVSRIRFGLNAIDPQVMAWSFTWRNDQKEVKEFRAQHGITETSAYIGSPIEAMQTSREAVRYRLRELDPEELHSSLEELAADGVTDYVVLPMPISSGNLLPFIASTNSPQGFCDDDIAKFEALLDFVIPILELMAMRQATVSLLDTYVGHRSGAKILSGQVKRGDGELIHAAMWFSDLRGFTALTENLEPAKILGLLNEYFEAVTAAVTARGGEVLRFIGDAMLIIFPADGPEATRVACESALDAAHDAFDSIATLNHQRRKHNEPEIRFGVGLHVGEAIYGNVGAPNRLDFTVMGPAVNRSARLEGLTKELGPPLLMSADFVQRLGSPTHSLGFHTMRGVVQKQEVFCLKEDAF